MTAIVAFPVLGFALVAALGHLTTEMTLTGVGARLLTAVVLLAGLCFVLPKALRFDLVAGMTAGVRALTRWIAPPNS